MPGSSPPEEGERLFNENEKVEKKKSNEIRGRQDALWEKSNQYIKPEKCSPCKHEPEERARQRVNIGNGEKTVNH